MKKTFFLAAFGCLLCASVSAQIKTYSSNDCNLDGQVNISDVNSVISEMCGVSSSKQMVSADSLCVLLNSINSRLAAIEKKLGIEDSTVTPTPDPEPTPSDTHEYVDLGLPSGTLWATCNVGATSPEEYGLYFAWGETTGYTSGTSDGRSFNWANYKWMTSGQSAWTGCTKYTFADGQTSGCWYSNGTYVGTTVDGTTYTNLTKLEAADDAATANWGINWCMPTYAQQQELVNSSYTSTEWTTVNGVYGRKITSLSNGNSLFLPAAGCRYDASPGSAGTFGHYWSRTLSSYDSGCAYYLYFHSSDIYWGYSDRYYGRSVRPVRVQN